MPPNGRRVAALAALCTVGVTVAVFACSPGVSDGPATAGGGTADGGAGIVEGGPVAYNAELSEGGNDGSLEGQLQASEACVTIVDLLGQRWLPIFQRPRTTWDGTTLTYNGKSYTDGSTISLRGGGVDVEVADYAPATCDFDLAFVVAP